MIDDGLEHNPLVSRRALAQLHEGAFGWALSLSGHDVADAEDVMQQAYLLLLEGRARFDGRASLKTWLYAVIRNVARRERRRGWLSVAVLSRLATDLDPEEAATSVSQVLTGSEPNRAAEAQRMRIAMRSLSLRQREVLELVFDAEFTLEEAAHVIGVSTGSARTHYHRAKQKLRQEMESFSDD